MKYRRVELVCLRERETHTHTHTEQAISWPVQGLPNRRRSEQNELQKTAGSVIDKTVERLEFRAPPPSAGPFLLEKIISLQSMGGGEGEGIRGIGGLANSW